MPGTRPISGPVVVSNNGNGRFVVYPTDARAARKDMQKRFKKVLLMADKPLARVLFDLHQYLQLYMYRPWTFDRKDIIARLEVVVELVDAVLAGGRLAELPYERILFLRSVYRLAGGIVRVIDAVWAREETRKQLELDMRLVREAQARPSFKHDLSPWRQFLAAGAPALPMVRSQIPTAWPVHVALPPKFTQLRATSVQTFPASTSAILGRWGQDFREMLHFLRQRHPRDPAFQGSVASKLVTREPFFTDDDGMIVEEVRVRQVAPITHPYARASRRGLELGLGDRTTIVRFLTRLDRRGHAVPVMAATRCYVVRQWKVMEEK